MNIFKATKKPVQVEAVHWDGTAEGATPIIDWVLSNGGTAHYACTTQYCSGRAEDHVLVIRTLEGEMDVQVGGYIIRGVEGEFYPCRADIFRKTYTYEGEVQ